MQSSYEEGEIANTIFDEANMNVAIFANMLRGKDLDMPSSLFSVAI